MTTFDRAVDHFFLMEAGYSNDPHDPGGETNFGISKRYHPHEDIKRMTRERAAEICREEYWDPLSCEDMPDALAFVVFDSGANQGVFTAAKLLQQELRVTDDGIIGPVTLGNVNGHSQPLDLLHGFMARRAVRYAEGDEHFRRGWFRRLFHVHGAALG